MLRATIVAVAELDMLVDRWRTVGFSDDNLLIWSRQLLQGYRGVAVWTRWSEDGDLVVSGLVPCSCYMGATGGFARKHADYSTASALLQPRDAKILTTPSLGCSWYLTLCASWLLSLSQLVREASCE
jgi:hypothetical protein